MQTTKITLVANRRPEVLERILRVIRHRGFCVTYMQMKSDNEKIRLDFGVQSEREIHLLLNQLVKLYDVIDVNID